EPKTMATYRSDSDRSQSIMDWLQTNSKVLGIGAAVVVVAAAFYWFYTRSIQIKAENAERSLLTAQQSLASGNAGLARSDLQKVIDRYGGTSAGSEAALLLAQLDYEQSKFQDGINVLKKEANGGAPGPNLSSIYSLTADGSSQLGKPAEAAKQYQRAADATSYPNEKAYQLAKAARAFATAGDTAQARKLWSSLATDSKAQAVAAEARVRLAELDAKPAG
ncbi:MAG TPA: tetratricopeptide repeat protein, partial [Acidobacteriaceae bacterium]|nr:tetratricopeptide repeat protein [Acidobacteriaceae bacterium]